MKLSFSTKGWHDASWEDFLTAAQDLGFEGIEIHNLNAPSMQKKGAPADAQASAAVYRALFDRHLSVPCMYPLSACIRSGRGTNLTSPWYARRSASPCPPRNKTT